LFPWTVYSVNVNHKDENSLLSARWFSVFSSSKPIADLVVGIRKFAKNSEK
jgi:hypothetical protein